ncbi:MAG: hypothetical protein E7355_04120 [Clostridiales bacterium]|nr:hypothetical protein [Clostridiales bacterium]
MDYTIKNEKISVTVTDFGAEVISVVVDGKERLWQNPTGEWAGHAPLLFPVCGHFGVTVDGKTYPIKAHGFAKRMPFTLVDSGEDFFTFSISSNEETKRVYPYDFVFSVTYRVADTTLFIEYDVQNPAKKALYFACGGHESFALDTDVDGYEIEFDDEEDLTHYYHDDGGYLTGKTQKYGNGKPLPLPIDFLQNGDTLIFKDVRSRGVKLVRKGGKPIARVTFDGFSNLLLWRQDEAKYICIEPWTNLPDYAALPDKEFSQKDGVVKVEGNSNKRLVRTITYL